MNRISQHIRQLIIMVVLALGFSGAWHRGIAQNKVREISITIPERIHVLGIEQSLYNIRDIELTNSRAYVLTEPEPAVHVFKLDSSIAYRSWGSEGPGPNELDSPDALQVDTRTGNIYILDGEVGRAGIKIFAPDGHLLKIISITEGKSVATFAAVDRQFLIHQWQFLGQDNTLMLIDSAGGTPILNYKNPRSVLLAPDDGPIRRMHVIPPFSGPPAWIVRSDNRIAFWPGAGDSLQILSLDGQPIALWPIPQGRIPVEDRDRDLWIDRKFPPDAVMLSHKRAFEAIRREAREDLTFPEAFAPVLDLMSGPCRTVWVLRADKASGERWLVMASNQTPILVRLPAGRQLSAVGREFLALAAQTDSEVETVELYNRHAWARSLCAKYTRD